jgi:uncharacterized membrane protein YfcA
MITNKTHTVDWNKTAHIACVVIVAIVQCAWWLAKHIGKIAVAVLTVLAKVFVALVSVWASTPDNQTKIDPSKEESAPHSGVWLGFHPGDQDV